MEIINKIKNLFKRNKYKAQIIYGTDSKRQECLFIHYEVKGVKKVATIKIDGDNTAV